MSRTKVLILSMRESFPPPNFEEAGLILSDFGRIASRESKLFQKKRLFQAETVLEGGSCDPAEFQITVMDGIESDCLKFFDGNFAVFIQDTFIGADVKDYPATPAVVLKAMDKI